MNEDHFDFLVVLRSLDEPAHDPLAVTSDRILALVIPVRNLEEAGHA